MRLIKGFILAVTGLFITITLISLLMPSKVMVSRGVVVNANAAKIFPQLINLRNWKNWQPIFKGDSANVTFSAVDSGDNAFCEWTSNEKVNRFVITSHTATTVSFSLVRNGENDQLNTISILPLPDTSTVQVEWKALTKLKWYPWEKFYGIFIDKLTGPSYDDALKSLKDYIEK